VNSDITLVDELVEGVLPVGPWLPPHDWSCVVVHTAAILGDVLPVRLHVALETKHTVTQVLPHTQVKLNQRLTAETHPVCGGQVCRMKHVYRCGVQKMDRSQPIRAQSPLKLALGVS